jgi:hypothetical protein
MLSYFFPSLTHRLLAVHLFSRRVTQSPQPSFLLIKPSSSASPPQILDIHLPTDLTLNKRKRHSQEWEGAQNATYKGSTCTATMSAQRFFLCSLWAPICQGIIHLKGHPVIVQHFLLEHSLRHGPRQSFNGGHLHRIRDYVVGCHNSYLFSYFSMPCKVPYHTCL